MPINPLFTQSSPNALNQLQGQQQQNNFKITQPGVATFTGQQPQGVNLNMGQKAASPDANVSAPNPTLPPKMQAPDTAGIQNQLGSAYNQLNDLQLKQSALQKYGLQDAKQLTKDASGNYVPVAGQPGSTQAFTPSGGLYGGLVSGLANTAQFGGQGVQKAIQDIQNLQSNFAQTGAQIAGTPGLGQQEAQGSQGLLQNLFANRMAAAQGALSNALQEQGLQQQGLGAAAILAQPMGAQTVGFYNPVTGQFTRYGGGQGGQGSGIAAAAQVEGNLSSGKNYYQTLLPNYNAAQNIVKSFNNWLDTPASEGGGQGVNFSQLNIGNQLQNWIAGQNFSDPRFPQLTTFLNEIGNKLSPIVGAVGGDISNYKRQLVSAMINPTASSDSIKQQVQSLLDIAGTTMNSIYSTFSNPQDGPPQTQTNSQQGGSDFFNQNWFQ